MNRQSERSERVADCMNKIRTIEAGGHVNLEKLQAIKAALIELAADRDLFSIGDFPPPDADSDRHSCLYRLSEDDDHRFALYINAADGVVNAPVHNHTTWAVIVGITGLEVNKFYDYAQTGVEQKSEARVEQGRGVCLLEDDLHSIHIEAGEPVINFHLYGLGLEQLHQRKYWSKREQKWLVFPAHSDIRDAR